MSLLRGHRPTGRAVPRPRHRLHLRQRRLRRLRRTRRPVTIHAPVRISDGGATDLAPVVPASPDHPTRREPLAPVHGEAWNGTTASSTTSPTPDGPSPSAAPAATTRAFSSAGRAAVRPSPPPAPPTSTPPEASSPPLGPRGARRPPSAEPALSPQRPGTGGAGTGNDGNDPPTPAVKQGRMAAVRDRPATGRHPRGHPA